MSKAVVCLNLMAASGDESEDSRRRAYRTYTEAAAHFDSSPHLPRYVSTLYIDLRSRASEECLQAVGSVLLRLRNVRTCAVFSLETAQWNDIPPEITDALLDWLSLHLTLHNFILWKVEQLPRTVLDRILDSAPCVRFLQVTVGDDDNDNDERMPATGPSRALELLSIWESPTVEAVLLLPDLIPHAQSVRKLVLDASPSNPLCFASAATLETLRLDCTATTEDADMDFPHHLPRLHHLSFIIRFSHIHQDPQTTRFLPRILESAATPSCTPALTRLTIQINILVPERAPAGYSLSESIMKALDTTVDVHPTMQTLRWIPFLSIVAEDDLGQWSAHLAAFSAALKQGLPKGFAKGRVVIEDPWEGVEV
ncbi:hypothetical protein C8F01DRAFT_1171412 [Mycena amicta]|nr:hypothetical protein C8F01DRAFT_1171412 [Mycena amicta]